ncbi:MAG TPA: hypothetical protein VGD98_16335 [Ktedonobacteraceae bacterium]
MPNITSTTKYPAKTAGNQCTSCTQRMPGQSTRISAQTMRGMWATANAATSILLIQTGVSASVSLFVLLIALGNLLLVTLIGLLGLTGLLSLSGLTGLVINLVGLIKGLVPGTMMGD